MMMLYKDTTEVKTRSVGRITIIECSVAVLNVFLGTAKSAFISRLSFARLSKHCERYGALWRALQRSIKS